MREIMITCALAITVLVNNILGGTNAIIEGKYNKETAKKGILKGIIISACGVCLYFASFLAPNISIGLFNGMEMTLNMALNTIVTGGFIYYAYQDILKLKELVCAKVNIGEIPSEIENISHMENEE